MDESSFPQEPFESRHMKFVEAESQRMTSASSADDVRCHCGQLIARLTEQGIELKCKRCRRLFVIPFSAIGGQVLSPKLST